MKLNRKIAYVLAVCLIASCLTNAGAFASNEDSGNKGAAEAAVATGPAVVPSSEDVDENDTASMDEPEETPAAPDPSASAAPSENPDASPAVTPSCLPSATPTVTPTPEPAEDESLWYREKLPLKKEHQKLLWGYCKTRKLDYIDMLALISTESNFNEKCSSGRYKGYFQISTSNAANLSKTLKTLNKPLDGAININWGTALYSWILADKRVKGIEDAKKKRDAALSIYQRGTGGYDKYGLSPKFLKRFYKMRSAVCVYFEDKTDKKETVKETPKPSSF